MIGITIVIRIVSICTSSSESSKPLFILGLPLEKILIKSRPLLLVGLEYIHVATVVVLSQPWSQQVLVQRVGNVLIVESREYSLSLVISNASLLQQALVVLFHCLCCHIVLSSASAFHVGSKHLVDWFVQTYKAYHGPGVCPAGDIIMPPPCAPGAGGGDAP